MATSEFLKMARIRTPKRRRPRRKTPDVDEKTNWTQTESRSRPVIEVDRSLKEALAYSAVVLDSAGL